MVNLNKKGPIKTVMKDGIKVQWLHSPYRDLQILRITGELVCVEAFVAKYKEVFKEPDFTAKISSIQGLPNGLAVAIGLRWLDDPEEMQPPVEEEGGEQEVIDEDLHAIELCDMKGGFAYRIAPPLDLSTNKVADQQFLCVIADGRYKHGLQNKAGQWAWMQGNIATDFPDDTLENADIWYERQKDGSYVFKNGAPKVTQEDFEIIRARSSVG